MRAYAAVLSARVRTLLQYRAAALAGIACQVFWGILRTAIFGAFFAMNPARSPMSLPEMVTYIWLGQSLFRMLPTGADGDVRALIRTGGVAYELTRPLDLYAFWYTRSVAMLAAPMLLRAVPLLGVAALFFEMLPPASPLALAAGLASLLCGLLLSAACVTLLTISLLWTVSGDGISRMAVIAVWAFSGILLPLPLFPEWLQPALALLPFRGLIDGPFRLYMGHIPAEQAPGVLLHQLGWTLALIALGRWLLGRGIRRMVVQGG
ncbi:MAG: ABC-2 family transporter protein [Planctomycetota bacterium]|nr:ABC-2 family transporter protein [Planctomycetota bacterium]